MNVICKENLKYSSLIPSVEFVKDESYEYYFQDSNLFIKIKGLSICFGKKTDDLFYKEEEYINLKRFEKLNDILNEER